MPVWYVTFHGGEESKSHHRDKSPSAEANAETWNNVHVFSLEGRPLGKALDVHSLPKDLELRELRGFAFGPGGDLFIANAFKSSSQVLRFAGTPDDDGKHTFREIFVERHEDNPGLHHPFDVTFGPDGHIYVPSQDTNVVGRYFGPEAKHAEPGAPMPHPEALQGSAKKHLLPGTFVPSREHAPSGVRTVRRAIFGPDGDLYVADRDTHSVKRYDGQSGTLLREYRHDQLSAPVHLLFRNDGVLLVGSRDQHAILAIDTETGQITPFVQPGAGGLQKPSGMALGPDGKLYVCSRDSRQILSYDVTTGEPDPRPFLDEDTLEDFPEFISLVDRS
jgi:glucose/arabinose dehydrogenase